MKKIGLIGGLSWHSTIEYYRTINELVNFRLRADHSAKCILFSVDFHVYAGLAREGKWDVILDDFVDLSRKLEHSGAECLVLCANTVHKIAHELSQRINIPLIDIADAVKERLLSTGILSTALLGTKFTMLGDHYAQRLRGGGISMLLPEEEEMEYLHQMIYTELAEGIFTRDSREWVSGLINRMIECGARSITLACTELPLLLRGEEFSVPLLDTTQIHSEAAVDFALLRE